MNDQRFSWTAKQGGKWGRCTVLFTHIKGEIAKGKVQSSNVKLSLSFFKSLRPWSNLRAPSVMTWFSFSNFFKLSLFFISPLSHSLTPLTQPRSRKKSVMVDLDINKVGSCPKKNFAFPFCQYCWKCRKCFYILFWSILLEIQKLFPVCFCQYCWDPR